MKETKRIESITANTARWIAGLDSRRLPGDVAQTAKYCLLDTLGVALAGVRAPAAVKVRKYALNSLNSGAGSIWGTAQTTSPELAALCNGTACHALDYDEVNYSSIAHPAAVLAPALLALAQERGCSGLRLLSAFVAGYELIGKLGAAVNPSAYHKGCWTSSLLGTIGAAAACSRLLGLDPNGIVTAIGLGVSFAAGLRNNFGTMAKPFGAGKAAMDGVMFSKLAQLGLSASPLQLEENSPLFAMVSDAPDMSILRRLGDPYELQRPGVAFKRYPSCSASHAAVDAILDLMVQPGLDRAEVRSIVCEVTPLVDTSLIYTNPWDPEQARFSLEACIAGALCRGRLDNEFFNEENLADPELRALMGCIKRRVRDDFQADSKPGEPEPKEAARLLVSLQGGGRLEKTVLFAKGNRENPLSFSELQDKFERLSRETLPRDRAAGLWRMVQNLESLPDAGVLGGLLAV